MAWERLGRILLTREGQAYLIERFLAAVYYLLKRRLGKLIDANGENTS